MENIEFIESIGKLEIKTGDIVVVKTQGMLKAEQLVRVKEVVTTFLENAGFAEMKILVLMEGMNIGLLRNSEA